MQKLPQLLKKTNIVIIGTGNLASHLALFISQHSDLNLNQLFNHRKTKEATLLAKQSNCDLVSKYNEIVTEADLYIICVNDDSIEEVAKNLIPLKIKNLVVHTSGSIDLLTLTNVSKQIGVFYPLQTFSKNDFIDWKSTPILLEANSKTVFFKLKTFSSSFSTIIKTVNSKERLGIHLAAVFGCNFTNALYAVSHQLLKQAISKNNVKLLNPILQQTFNKMLNIGPIRAQTGPAKRDDKITMQKHLALLKTNKQLSSIYKSLSDLIITQQNAKF